MLRFSSFYKVFLDFGSQHAVTNKIRDNWKKKSQLHVTFVYDLEHIIFRSFFFIGLHRIGCKLGNLIYRLYIWVQWNPVNTITNGQNKKLAVLIQVGTNSQTKAENYSKPILRKNNRLFCSLITLRDSSGCLLKGTIRFTDRLYRDSFELTLKAYALLLWNYN